MKTFELDHEISFDTDDKRTWEKRIDNCIKARDDAECPEFKVIWNQILEEILRQARNKTKLIN